MLKRLTVVLVVLAFAASAFADWRPANPAENVYGRQVRHVITFQKAPDVLYSPGPDGLVIGGPGWLQNYIDSVTVAKATARLLTEQMWGTFGNTDEHLEVFDVD